MIKLPNALVETWLLLATDTRQENSEASQVANQKIINVFGNIDVAQVYLEQNAKKSTLLVAEET